MNARRVAAYASGALGIVLLAAVLVQVFEIREVEVERSQGRAAAKDPWLALDRILSPDRAVERYSSIEDIRLDSAALAAVDGDELALLDAEGGGASGLARWVEGGGRLIVSWEESWDEEEGYEEIESFPGIQPTGRAEYGYGDTKARGKYRSIEVAIPFYGRSRFGPGDAADGYLGFSHGDADRIVLVESGSGWILAGASPLFLENKRLADNEGMAFAEQLLAGLGPGDAWLPEPSIDEAPSGKGGHKSTKAFIPVAIAAAILCLVLLWKEAPRFGPFVAEEAPDRRGMAERFRAEGRFLIERGAGGELLERVGAGPGSTAGSDAGADGRPGSGTPRSPRKVKRLLLAAIRDRAPGAAERGKGREA